MATAPPIKTTFDDIDRLSAFLRTQVGWTDIDTIKTQIPARHADNRKIEAMRYLGLLDRDGANVKLTEKGRAYASNPDDRPAILVERLREIPLYRATLSWLHWNPRQAVNKTDIANYWHDHQAGEIAGAAGAALTDAAVFFMRAAGEAALGKFVSAGVGRVTHFQPDNGALEAFVTGSPPVEPEEPEQEPDVPLPPPPPPPPPASVSLSPGLNVNVEIHIAADAKAATIEEIFKNMRKYLIEQPEPDAS